VEKVKAAQRAPQLAALFESFQFRACRREL
jgi:hypothetical protein